MRQLMIGLVVMLLAASAEAAVQTKTVSYKHGDLECKGFLAWDDAVEGKRPGVLVVHEWWGLDEYARSRAAQLAKLGYVAFACDMYGDGKVAEHPDDARKMASVVRMNVETWRKRAQVSLDVLKAQPQCDSGKLAAIGYCFGGSTALRLAYTGADLKAVATFHATLPAPTADEAKSLKARVLICHGGADTFIPEMAIKLFREPLDKAGTKYEFVAYPGVVHSFTVPGADARNLPGMKYDKQADEDSWKRMTKLFAEQFGK
ncbi:MAG: dienelactone hydrolase family protein [Planctomycetota bacterium]|nr:MAG: dienelactone hydrolase family protein [Planctomycetota bacterium]